MEDEIIYNKIDPNAYKLEERIINGKLLLDANTLQNLSLDLGHQIIKDNFKPNYILAIWRGGTAVGVIVHELLTTYYRMQGDFNYDPYHTAIKTQAYKHGQMIISNKVEIKGCEHVIEDINSESGIDREDRLLIIDDVHDTGITLSEFLKYLKKRTRKNIPKEIKIATPLYKPGKNQVGFEPDYYCVKYDGWVVFPHETLEIIQEPELVKQKNPKLYKILFSKD